MSENDRRLREALLKIAEVASAAVQGEDLDEHGDDQASEQASQEDKLACIPKTLPQRLLVKSAETATTINPVNAPVFGPLAEVDGDFQPEQPLRIAVLTSKYWGPRPRRLTVSFMESTPANLQAMNLEGFTMNTPESEYKRVIAHETGHTLGFPHEHMRRALVARIDPEKAYEYFRRTQGWDRQTVDQQVLTPLDERSLMSTPADQTSIMCYQLPGSITRDRRPILGGMDINQTDYAFAGRVYPKPSQDLIPEHEEDYYEFTGRIYPKPSQDLMPEHEEEWDKSEDVEEWDESEDVEVHAQDVV